MRVLTVFGTRPEAIKLAPVLRRLSAAPGIESLVCVTGQHRHMLDQVLTLFRIKPDFDLDLMRESQGLGYLTTAVLEGVSKVCRAVRPQRILVQGDTTTAFAAALAAFYEKIPVAHIEAGLRTRNVYSPWPEEMNRCMVSVLTDLHFAPTSRARQNLLAEGVDPSRISVSGNTVVDALLDAVAILEANPEQARALDAHLPPMSPGKRLILNTGHRRENFDGGLEKVAKGLRRLVERGDVEVIYPVHLNPKVQQAARSVLGGHPAIHLIPPLDYLPFVNLMRRAYLIVTDSGGVQEEAPSLGKPVLVTRDTTERPEAVEAGTVELVGADTELLVARANRLLDDRAAYDAMSFAHNPYGDGTAADRIVRLLKPHTGITGGERTRAAAATDIGGNARHPIPFA
jgi:UDP-N-acetylglucosamine 2-epimerase (non-hydrolysing)